MLRLTDCIRTTVCLVFAGVYASAAAEAPKATPKIEDVGLLDLLHRPYREQTINRDTVYRFKAGLPVHMLEASDGSRYAMQAYSQIVDKTLTYDQLDALGSKLKLPSGWRYTTTTPDQDLVLGAQGKATVIQDDFDNTYQKLD